MRLESQIESIVRAHSRTTAPRPQQHGWIPRSDHAVRLDPDHWSKRHRPLRYWRLIDVAPRDAQR